MLNKVIRAYVADTRPRLAQIRAAVEAGDSEALRTAAHGMKSSSANVGAERLAGYCRELETIGRGGTIDGARVLLDAATPELERVLTTLQAMANEENENARA